MSEQTREPSTQDQRTTTTTPTTAPGAKDPRADTTVPVDGMSPVIELDINPGPPPRPRFPEPKEVVEKTL